VASGCGIDACRRSFRFGRNSQTHAPATSIQLPLGHEDLEVPARYLHLSQQHLHQVANPIEELKSSSVEQSRRLLSPPAASMTRPAIKVADVVRAKGRQFLERFQSILSYLQLTAYRAVLRCRTAALGGHYPARRPFGRAARSLF
jgi:hypothetical protein